MKRSDKHILTTHAGSLVRTPELVELMIQDRTQGGIDTETYEKALAESVRDVVQRQYEAGIDVVDDGEYGKSSWITYIRDRVSGIEPVEVSEEELANAYKMWPEQDRYAGFYKRYVQYETVQWLPDCPSLEHYHGSQTAEYRNSVCTGPLKYNTEKLKRDIDDLKAALGDVEVEEAFLPVVAPCSMERIPNTYYDSQEDYLFALADCLHTEYKTIVDAGFLVQVDDAMMPLARVIRFTGQDFSEFRKWAELRMEALNHALKGIPEEKVRYHVCFGSQNAPHTSDLDLKDLIDIVFRANAQGYSFEACNPRHEHEFRIWEDIRLPEGKILIPGIIGHATNVVEHPELIAMRIKNFADRVGRENVIAGSDCGFSQTWNSPRVHAQIQWAKMEALAEGARIASRQLWAK